MPMTRSVAFAILCTLVGLAAARTEEGDLTPAASEPLPVTADVEDVPEQVFPNVWGIAGLRGAIAGEKIAPNGWTYDPVFTLDLDFNLMLMPRHLVYLFF